jgi:hypothetical protein
MRTLRWGVVRLAAMVLLLAGAEPRGAGAGQPAGAACAGSLRDWVTDAGCVVVQRCPGVRGRPCTKACVPPPQRCAACPSCDCLAHALCGSAATGACRQHEITCAAP